MPSEWTWFDGVERLDYQWSSDGRLVRRHSSLGEDRIMTENARVRANGGSRSLSFGKLLMRMSYAQYVFLTRVNPALASSDKREQLAAWKRLASDGGYRNLQVEDH